MGITSSVAGVRQRGRVLGVRPHADPRPHRAWWRRASTLACVLVLAGVCAGAVVAAPAGATTSNARELAQAHKALLVLADLPAGWTSTKNTSNDNNDVGTTQLAHCIGVAANLVAENPPSVNSPQFQDKQGLLMVTDNVTVFPSTANAAAEYAIVTNAKTPGCMTTLAAGPLKAQLFGTTPKGVTIGTPLVSPVASSAFGPGIAGYSLSVPITTHGQVANFTVTQLFAVKGRFGEQVTFTAIGEPFSIALERHLVTVGASRL